MKGVKNKQTKRAVLNSETQNANYMYLTENNSVLPPRGLVVKQFSHVGANWRRGQKREE